MSFALILLLAQNPVDEHLGRAWASAGIPPAPAAAPHEFLRRLTLDVLGRLPKLEEIRAYERDPDPVRRVDELLASDEAAEYAADLWIRILLAYRFDETLPLKISFPAFRAWLKQAAKDDLPFRDFTRDLVAGTGDYRQKPASNFILAALDPAEPPHEVTNRVTRVFLGLQLQCARCHDHPFEKWTQEDFWGLTAFFAGLKPKARQTFDGFGIKLMAEPGTPAMMAIPDSKTEVPARFPGGARPPEGKAPLPAMADWILSHPQFARTIVNRTWARLMGRGFVEPVDKFTAASQAAHPELLEALAADFVRGGTRLRPLMRTILTARAYRAASAGPAGASGAHAAMILKPLNPVQLLNVLTSTLNMEVFFQEFYRQFTSNKDLPETYRNPEVFRMFLHLYMQSLLAPGGQAPEEARYAGSVRLALKLMNSPDLQNLVKAEWGRLAELLKRETTPEGRLDAVFLTLLSRPPSAEERERFLAHATRKKGSKEAFEDAYWVLLNSTEFIFNH